VATDGWSPPQRVRLTIPARPEFLRIARLAAVDMGERVGMSLDELDDVRIAVDELAHVLLASVISGDPTIELVFTIRDGELRVEGRREGTPASRPLETTQLAGAIVRAASDEHSLGADEHGARFLMSKRARTSV
jgi:serine/threonine-protein kinase RsbW